MRTNQVRIPQTQIVNIPAEDGRAYRLSIALPPLENGVNQSYPAMYILDDHWFFAMFTQIIRTLQLFNELPPLYIIGVGYPTDDLADILALRMRDYTPTPIPTFVEQFSENYGLPLTPLKPGSGDAAGFHRDVGQRIIPLVEAKYPVDPSRRLLAGWSFSGLFGLYDLFAEKRWFSDYIVISPSLWWDDGVLFEYEAECAGRKKDLQASLHLSAGSNEGTSMLEGVEKLHAILEGRSYGGLALAKEMYPDETHLSVVAGAFSRGIRMLFRE